jgi:hypothetical protein
MYHVSNQMFVYSCKHNSRPDPDIQKRKGPSPSQNWRRARTYLPKIDNRLGLSTNRQRLSFSKVRARCRYLEGPGPLSFWEVQAHCRFLENPNPLSFWKVPVVDFWKVRARCVFGRSEPVVFLEGPGPLSIFGRFGPVVNIWTVQARCRYLEGQGSLSIFGKSGLVVFWKVRARCLFGKSRPVVDFWKVRARCFFGKSGPVVFLVDSGWAPGGFWVRSVPGRLRVGSMSGPVGLWVDSERVPGRFRVVSGSILGGFRVGPRWTLRGSGSIPLGSGSDQAGSGWFSGRLRVVSG